MNLQIGDKVDVIDCSWSYVITNKLAKHELEVSCGRDGWVVVAANQKLPTPMDSNYTNDVIIRKGSYVAFIYSEFLKLTTCPTCNQLIK